MKKIAALLFLLSQSLAGLVAQNLKIENCAIESESSFRGLSVVDDSIAFVSGAKGQVGRTLNGARNWTFTTVPDCEKLDFRSIYAFDKDKVLIANAGTPARILLTTDGGKNWIKVYENADSAAFFDGIDFWNDKEGIAFGDPIKGEMLLLFTKDGGKNWQKIKGPELATGEASFAASGTTLRCFNTSSALLATGGKQSRIFISYDKGLSWKFREAPITQGSSSKGIFSVALKADGKLIIVGGDYLQEDLSTDNCFYSENFAKDWKKPLSSTRGYRECVEYIGSKKLLALGPKGIDLSPDNGLSWLPFSDDKDLHVVRKARKGKLIVFAGKKKIARLVGMQ